MAKMLGPLLPLLLSLAPSVSAAACGVEADPNQVQTSSGLVQGHVASWPNDTTVVEYLGIPFAQPPVGELRFAAPVAFKPNTTDVFVADKFSADCLQFLGSSPTTNVTPEVQAYGYGMGGGSAEDPHTYSEDCLSINVWTKPTDATDKAVMLWIYGGGFSAGTSNAPFYNGARLAQDEDVVVVSFNYRINIFGFPNAPGNSTQNVGLLDQRLAVEWVRDNIAGFGGSPSRITLFGESAGGASVDLYSYAWTEDPIVAGFIEESGTAFLSSSPEVNTTAWYNVSATLGCGGEEAGEETVECLRTKSADDITRAAGELAGGALGAGFGPAADGKVVFADVKNRSAAGQFIQKPLLGGNNDNELGLILALGNTLFSGAAPGNLSTDDLIKFGSAAAFNCPAALTAKDRAANNVPTWRYRYMGVWNNTALVPGMGAYHSSEIPFVFGTNELRPNSTPDVPEEAKLATVMMHAWAEFAKDPVNGLVGLQWPLYDVNGTTLIRLGYNNQSEVNFGPSTQYDELCPLLGY